VGGKLAETVGMAIDEAAEIAELHRVFELQHQACLDDPELKWRGNCNELNGGYAADGYARTISEKY